jgi:hypothetical protein
MDQSPQESWGSLTSTLKDFFTTLRQTGLDGLDRLKAAASLLDHGVDINGLQEKYKHIPYGSGAIEARTKVTALYDAAQRGDYEAVQFLISRGADVTVRNVTGMGLHMGPFPARQIETLRALDGMRTSGNLRIVQLAEEMYGVETQEEFVRRRDAFDELMHPRYAREREFEKESKRRVKSVLPKSSAKKSPEKKSQSGDSGESTDAGEKRYDLRSRNSNLSYT